MPQKKRQHYLPRFYLRRFGSGRRQRSIALYHIPTRRFVRHASIRREACASYFYGRDTFVEDTLATIEAAVAPLIAQAVERGDAPRGKASEAQALVYFAVLQSGRTPDAAETMDELFDKMVRAAYSRDPVLGEPLRHVSLCLTQPVRWSLLHSMILAPLAFDLGVALLRTDTSRPFITSDTPVVRYNQYMEGRERLGSDTGLASMGLQMFYPISPLAQLLFYDRDIYHIEKPQGQPVRVARADVDALNTLQCAWACEKIYVPQEVGEEYVRQRVEDSAPFRRSEKGSVTEYVAADGRPESLLVSQMQGVKCGLSLSFCRVWKKARSRRLGHRAVQVRDERRARMMQESHEHLLEAIQRGDHEVVERLARESRPFQ